MWAGWKGFGGFRNPDSDAARDVVGVGFGLGPDLSLLKDAPESEWVFVAFCISISIHHEIGRSGTGLLTCPNLDVVSGEMFKALRQGVLTRFTRPTEAISCDVNPDFNWLLFLHFDLLRVNVQVIREVFDQRAAAVSAVFQEVPVIVIRSG